MNVTNPEYTHKYNPNGPAGYFLTFHTYGTWLHGSAAGSIDRKNHNIPGTPVVPQNSTKERAEKNRLKQSPVTFTSLHRESVASTVKQVCTYKGWTLHALAVRTEHVHIVITASKPPEHIMNSLKSWCTRQMREHTIWNRELSPWSRHGSTRYLWNEKEIYDACNYVIYGQTKAPLPYGRGTACGDL